MLKVFLKSLFLIFGWIILLANLLYAFNMVSLVITGYGTIIGGNADYSTKYFGVSSFISILTDDNYSIAGDVVTYLKAFINKLNDVASFLFSKENDYVQNWVNIKNIGDFFKAVGQSFLVIPTLLASIFLYTFSLAITLVVIVFTLINIYLNILGFLTGAYAKDLPNTYHLSIMDILKSGVLILSN